MRGGHCPDWEPCRQLLLLTSAPCFCFSPQRNSVPCDRRARQAVVTSSELLGRWRAPRACLLGQRHRLAAGRRGHVARAVDHDAGRAAGRRADVRCAVGGLLGRRLCVRPNLARTNLRARRPQCQFAQPGSATETGASRSRAWHMRSCPVTTVCGSACKVGSEIWGAQRLPCCSPCTRALYAQRSQ